MRHYDIYAEKFILCDLKVAQHKSHLLYIMTLTTFDIHDRDIVASDITPPHPIKLPQAIEVSLLSHLN